MPFSVYDASCCPPCTPGLQIATILFVGVLPSACCLLLPLPPFALVGLLAALTVPRTLWREGGAAEGVPFVAALSVTWNLIMLVCFGSPLLVAVCCWSLPRVCVPLLATYISWTRVLSRPDLTGDGAAWPRFVRQEWVFHAFRRYLGLRIHVADELRALPAEEPVIIGIHPHGSTSDYRVLMDGMLYDALPGRPVFTLSASVLFRIPIVRELCLWTRCIDARKTFATRALKRGRSLMVIPGGELEQLRTAKGREEVYLSKRLGFVKLALQAGVALVPCYVFGCVDLFDTYSAFRGKQEWLRRNLGVGLPAFLGSCGFLPRRVPVNIVMGEPLKPACAVKGSPTDEEVAAAHAAYTEALRRLFDTHKAGFGFGDRELVVT